jgi:RimJ/RimL family protein N-acetyltransferase
VDGRSGRVPAARAGRAGAPEAALGLFEPGGGAVVGGAGLHRTLGLDGCTVSYWLATPYLGQGYATEVAAALTRVAFEHHGVGRVEIHVDAENARSAAVAHRLGFRLVGTRRRLVDTGERRLVERPIEIHRLTRVTYPRSPSAAASLSAFDRHGARLLPV